MKLSLNVGLAWPDAEHIYLVGHRGQTVGKVWFAVDRRRDPMPWEWHLCLPMTLPNDTRGISRSKVEALQAIANSLHRLMVRTPPERLERAYAFAASAGMNFVSGEEIEFVAAEVEAPKVVPVMPPAVVPARATTLSAAVQAMAQKAAAPPAAAASTAPGNLPGSRQVVVAKKPAPTVRVKMVTPDKVVRPQGTSPTASSAGQSGLSSGTKP